jgi:hypothetical protein
MNHFEKQATFRRSSRPIEHEAAARAKNKVECSVAVAGAGAVAVVAANVVT